MTPTIVASAPLVRIQVFEPTHKPVPGKYYQHGDGRLLLCISERTGLDTYYWFVDAAAGPLTVLSEQQLAENPLKAIELVPVKEHAL